MHRQLRGLAFAIGRRLKVHVVPATDDDPSPVLESRTSLATLWRSFPFAAAGNRHQSVDVSDVLARKRR